MATSTHTAHITPADGNVFADLGFDPGLAKALQAESQRIIAAKLTAARSVSDDAQPDQAKE